MLRLCLKQTKHVDSSFFGFLRLISKYWCIRCVCVCGCDAYVWVCMALMSLCACSVFFAVVSYVCETSMHVLSMYINVYVCFNSNCYWLQPFVRFVFFLFDMTLSAECVPLYCIVLYRMCTHYTHRVFMGDVCLCWPSCYSTLYELRSSIDLSFARIKLEVPWPILVVPFFIQWWFHFGLIVRERTPFSHAISFSPFRLLSFIHSRI